MIQLEALSAVRPSAYNPRVTDPARLQLIELSLRLLGFLLPIYADETGEISSGHQRHLVAERMGLTLIPVERIGRKMTLDGRRALNVMFNRATNDMGAGDAPAELTRRWEDRQNLVALAASLPHVDPTNPREMYPCLYPEMRSVKELARVNTGRWNGHARNLNRQLARKGINMPVIVRPDGYVLNGIGRLESAAEDGVEQLPVVVVPDARAELAEACLNLISMDFDLETRYADFLRYSSFRRARVVVPGNDLGYGFTMFAFGDEHPSKFDMVANPSLRMTWERVHGSSVMDFGAGRLKETHNLRALGFRVTAFEPFYCPDGDTISREETLALAREFLRDVADGVEWDSIFLSAVLNSVPFYQDRVHILRIVQACCTARTRGVFVTANSVHHAQWEGIVGGEALLSENMARSGSFIVSYEPGTKMGDLYSGKPKVQKFHSAEEFAELLGLFWEDVQVGYYMRGVTKGIGRRAKPVNAAELRTALEFEFNMLYPDGERLGLHGEAVMAFEKRLGVPLS